MHLGHVSPTKKLMLQANEPQMRATNSLPHYNCMIIWVWKKTRLSQLISRLCCNWVKFIACKDNFLIKWLDNGRILSVFWHWQRPLSRTLTLSVPLTGCRGQVLCPRTECRVRWSKPFLSPSFRDCHWPLSNCPTDSPRICILMADRVEYDAAINSHRWHCPAYDFYGYF